MTDTSQMTNDHLFLFGVIINTFAEIEIQMQFAAAGMLDTHLGTAIIMMGDTPYRQKQQTLRHLNTTTGIGGQINQEMVAILDDLNKRSKLRNQIAHSAWVNGQGPGTIKPMQVQLRGKRPRELGHWHNEKDYTVDDLKAEAQKLGAIHQRFGKLLEQTGLMARVEANIAQSAEPTSPSRSEPSATSRSASFSKPVRPLRPKGRRRDGPSG